MVFAITISMASEKNDKEVVASNASATTVVSGSVIDQETNETLVGVKIELEGTNQVVYTDFDGNYTFVNVKPGTYNLTATYVSYETKSLKDISVNPSNNEMIISLKTSN